MSKSKSKKKQRTSRLTKTSTKSLREELIVGVDEFEKTIGYGLKLPYSVNYPTLSDANIERRRYNLAIL